MSFPTITIKGNNPVKKKAVEAFLDLCLAAQIRCRRIPVEPDVLELVFGH